MKLQRRTMATAMAIVLGMGGLTACAKEADVPTPSSTTSAAPSSKTYKPVKDFAKGIQLFWHPQGDADYVRSSARRSVEYIAGLGANSIGITFPVYADRERATHIGPGADTPTVDELKLVVQLAHQHGLSVHVRMLVDDASLKTSQTPDAWRGTLVPKNTSAWFGQYAKLAASYVPALAGVQDFTVAAEMKALQEPQYVSQWQRVVQTVKSAGFTGDVVYAYNWDTLNELPFDSYGVDAYPKVDLPDTASVEQIASSITAWVNTLPDWLRERMVFEEIGIAALSGSYRHPWEWGVAARSQLHPAVQSKWFTAMCQVARQSGIHGIYYWMLDSNDTTMLSNAEAAIAPAKSFVGRTGEDAIRHCFANP